MTKQYFDLSKGVVDFDLALDATSQENRGKG